jgi:hypothetical protein
MANGKHHDNPLTDMLNYGEHPFPADIEDALRRVHELGRRTGRWPLGENCPFSGREFDWEKGVGLDAARQELANLIAMLEAGRGDEVLVDPLTQKPFSNHHA